MHEVMLLGCTFVLSLFLLCSFRVCAVVLFGHARILLFELGLHTNRTCDPHPSSPCLSPHHSCSSVCLKLLVPNSTLACSCTISFRVSAVSLLYKPQNTIFVVLLHFLLRGSRGVMRLVSPSATAAGNTNIYSMMCSKLLYRPPSAPKERGRGYPTKKYGIHM